MSKMEEVARAILPFTGCVDEEWRGDAIMDAELYRCVPEHCACRKAARAAIDALSEPSEAMVEAMAAKGYGPGWYGPDAPATKNAWRHMMSDAFRAAMAAARKEGE